LAGWLEYFAVIASTFQLLRLLFIDYPSPSPSHAHLQRSLPGAGAAMAAEAQGPAADQLPLVESDAADLQPPAAAEAAAVDLPAPPAAKQKLLELEDSLSRLNILQRFLEQHGIGAAPEGRQ